VEAIGSLGEGFDFVIDAFQFATGNAPGVLGASTA
jgi:hypothetical protein